MSATSPTGSATPGTSPAAPATTAPPAAPAAWITPLWLFVGLLFVLPVLPTFPGTAVGAVAGDGKYFAAGLLAVLGAAWVSRIVPRSALEVAAAVAFAYTLLLSLAMLIDVQRVIARDALELYKPVVAASSFLLGLGVVFRAPRSVPVLWRGMILFLLFMWALGVVEVALPDLARFYKRDSEVLFRKPITFFHTTYFAASVYLLMGSMFTVRAVLARRLLPDALYAGAAFLLLLLTQSRSAVLALLVVLAWAALLLSVLSVSDSWATLRRLIVAVGVAGAVGAYGFYFAVENLPYLTTGIQRYVLHWDQNLTGGGSLATRLGQVLWAVEENRIAVTGAGIGKAYNPLLESWYALYYYRYGLAGMLLYVGIWGSFWLCSLRRVGRVRRTMGRDAASFVVGLNVFLVGLPIVSFSSVITDQVFLIPFFYGLLGAGFGILATANDLAGAGPLRASHHDGGRPSAAEAPSGAPA